MPWDVPRETRAKAVSEHLSKGEVMATLFVLRSFQYNGQMIRGGEMPEDATLTVSDEELERERKRGRHPRTKRWLSPLLNHCQPADNATAQIMGEPSVSREADSEGETGGEGLGEHEDESKLEDLRAEFDKIGKAFDRRWGLGRLRRELTKAKKEVGA
jgi:hypothetical protein